MIHYHIPQLMKKLLATAYLTLAICTLASASSALFVKNHQMLLGKNFDWNDGEGVILLNKRDVNKVAYGLDKKNVVAWKSRYSSITFNQVGKEFPYGGVNERGLAIEMLWYDDSHYEESGQPTVSELEWIQFNLDNYKTAAEVQFYLDSMNINPLHANLHYIVADRGGRSFVVDFVNGKAVVSNTEEEFQALTNSNYLESLEYYTSTKNNIDFDSRQSLDRFCQLSSKADTKQGKTVQEVFDILSESSEDGNNYKTYWTVVYDLPNSLVYYKSYDSKKVKKINLNDAFSISAPGTFAIDVNNEQVYWQKYTPEWNLKLLSAALEKAQVKLNIPQANQHMMEPGSFEMDEAYSKNHKDLKINFNIKKQKGVLFYSLMEGEENYEKFRGSVSAMVEANSNTIQKIYYSFPIGNVALAAFHDLNKNATLDKFLGIPSEPTAFSNGAKGLFGPPKFEKVKFNVLSVSEMTIQIK